LRGDWVESALADNARLSISEETKTVQSALIGEDWTLVHASAQDELTATSDSGRVIRLCPAP